ncbi:MAG: PTS sugar transporter subunit IIA [Aerococcus sp.]|nr:PTS sugar transporter subunit IIA [Aerococcus sp.]
MLKYFKENQLVQYVEKQPKDWQEAVRVSCQPLIEGHYITDDYANEIVNNVVEHGPYIVIADQIAMPHALAESPGVLGTGISFTKFQEPVHFYDEKLGEDKYATLFFTLAAKDADSHLKNIQDLMELLMNEEAVAALLATHSKADYEQVLSEFGDV